MEETFISGPIYFFDQSPGRPRCKRTRMLDLSHGRRNSSVSPHLESHKKSTCKKPVPDGECVGDDYAVFGEATRKSEMGRRDTSLEMNDHGAENDTEKCTESPPAALQDELCQEVSLLEEYRHAAPQLLLELERLLRQSELREEGFFPRGLRNVLTYTWSELTEGAVNFVQRQWRPTVQKLTKPRKTKGSVASDKPSADSPQGKATNVKEKMRKKNNVEEKSAEKLHQRSTNLRIKPNVTNGHKPLVSHLSTTVSFSISSDIFQEQGWMVQSEDLPHDDPQGMALCRWAVDRLQLAQITIKEQAAKLADQGFTQPLLLRHYGDAKREGAGRHNKQGGRTCPFSLCRGRPSIPEARPEELSLQKLHYRPNDGTAFVYYPSGHIAVCQSHSGLPRGGLYTNVFADAPEASVLATFTPFGRGTITHPLRGTITTWDHIGGVVCDPDGTVTREWTWSPESRQNKPIIIEVTELISVRVWSATSASLWFRGHQERVQLLLSSLPNEAPPKVPVAVRSSGGVLEVLPEAQGWEEGFGKRGWADQDLSRLQRTVRNILEGWLEHYRQATGTSCPVIQRVRGVPVRHSFPKRKAKSAVLPTLNPMEVQVEKPDTAQPPGGSAEQLAAPRYTSAPAGRIQSDHAKGSRSSRQGKEEPQHVTETGALRVQSNIRLNPVVILRSPEMRRPIPVPCSPCPILMRAALLGEEGRRQCRCSNRRMPLLTDLEYDTFVGGLASCGEQILVVCVTPAVRPATLTAEDDLDQLYRRRNKHRSMPCTQCYVDSFRLMRYEVPTSDSLPGTHNALLQQRNNVASGMFLMYAGGKLLFADHIFNGYSCSVRDLQKQIAKTRQDYRQGQSLPPDFRFSPQVGIPRVGGGVPTTPRGLGCKSVTGAERCTSQAPLLSEKRIPQTCDRTPPAQDSATSLTLRSHQQQAKRTGPATLPFLPIEGSPQRAGSRTLPPGCKAGL